MTTSVANTPAASAAAAPAVATTTGLAGLSSLRNTLFANVGTATVGTYDDSKKMCAAIFADGIYERRNTEIGAFTYKFGDMKLPYLSHLGNGQTGFTFTLPKPGYGILLSIADFFLDIMQRLADSEVMVQLYWDKEESKYFLYVPEQKVAKATIAATHSQELQGNPQRYIWVLDIHSHNTMGAFFSGTDSADEISTRVFGVMGQISKGTTQRVNFTCKWRAGVNGKFVELTAEDIWDMENVELMPIPESDYAKVQRGTAAYTGAVYPVGGGVARGNHYPVNTYQNDPLTDDDYAWWQRDYGGGSSRRNNYSKAATAVRTAINTSDGEDVRRAFFELYSDAIYRDVAKNIYNLEVRAAGKTLQAPFVQTVADQFNVMLKKLIETTDLTDDDLVNVIVASASEHFGEEVMRKSVDRFQQFKAEAGVDGVVQGESNLPA